MPTEAIKQSRDALVLVSSRMANHGLLTLLASLVNVVTMLVLLTIVLPGLNVTRKQASENETLIRDNHDLLLENNELIRRNNALLGERK